MGISVGIMAYGNHTELRRCIDSIIDKVDEVIVNYGAFADEQSVHEASRHNVIKQFNVMEVSRDYPGVTWLVHIPQPQVVCLNELLVEAKNEWFFLLSTDEYVEGDFTQLLDKKFQFEVVCVPAYIEYRSQTAIFPRLIRNPYDKEFRLRHDKLVFKETGEYVPGTTEVCEGLTLFHDRTLREWDWKTRDETNE